MASCPNCGFDLSPEGSCAVCGYGSPSARGRAGSRSPSRRRAGVIDAGEPAGAGNGEVERAGLLRRSRVKLLVAGGSALLILAGAAAGVLSRGPGAVPASPANRRGAGEKPAIAGDARGAGAPAAARGAAAGSAPALRAADKRPAGKSPSSDSQGDSSVASSTEISRVGFAAPVGASPVGIRATHPINLYNPPEQPVYNLDRRTGLPPLTNEYSYVSWMLAHTDQQAMYLRERWHRAQLAVERHLVVHRRVLMAFLLTPREWFARPYNLSKVYANTALPIGYGQTISGPDLVMHMTDALDPRPDQRVLEIGTGSGYQSAVLSQLSDYVYTIEIVKPLARQTNQIYLDHTKEMPEYANIHRRLADGYYGWPAYAPFDRIIVTTGIDHIPPDLLKELKPGGIMVIPIGPPTGQTILKITKSVDAAGRVHLTRTNLYPGVTDIFVPFTATGGGTHDTGGTVR